MNLGSLLNAAKKDRKHLFPEGHPLREFYDLAGDDKDLLKKMEEWEQKWVVQYQAKDNASDLIKTAKDPDELTDLLLKREQAALKFISEKIAQDCTEARTETSGILNKREVTYTALALRKTPNEESP